MGHHKRKRPKNRRAGCLMCKFHKSNSYKGSLEAQTIQERKAREAEIEQIEDYYDSTPLQYDGRGALYFNWENTWEDWQHTWSLQNSL